MIWVEGGQFTFGNDDAYPEEAIEHQAFVKGFWISAHEITNKQFAEFVAETNYITLAETYLAEEDYPDIPEEQRMPGSFVFVSSNKSKPLLSRWRFIAGANWKHPAGPASDIKGKDFYPVVHIAYQDALAYAHWKGHSLPTEKQWEYAAKAKSNKNTKYAWGNEFTIDGKHQANTWQGLFPIKDSGDDGYQGISPVACFPTNDKGLYDMIGNVWEWTSSWYYDGHLSKSINKATGYDVRQPEAFVRVIKGGSFLCSHNYCRRFRPSARHPQNITHGTSHIGFRTVKNIPEL